MCSDSEISARIRELSDEALLSLSPLFSGEKQVAETSLLEFVRQAWALVEPEQAFVPGWHIEALCLHLEAMSQRDDHRLRKLLVNLPFSMMKSLLCCVFWPCWVWTRQPGTRWLFATYSTDFSTSFSTKRRDLLLSNWYQARWGDRVRLTKDQNLKTRFENTRKGEMMATGTAGAIGRHPDFLVIDDPHDPRNLSPVNLEAVRQWWDQTIVSRGVLRDRRMVVIMQRLHELDLSAHILSHDPDFTHICLPWEYEPNRMQPTPLGWNDPRNEPGQVLWPAMQEPIERESRRMSPHVQAGQLQQRPSSPKGEFFERDWFQTVGVPPAKGKAIRYWDLASTKSGGDFTAGVLIVRERDTIHCDADGRPTFVYYVVDVVHGQWDLDERDRILVQTTRADSQTWDDYKVVLEQEPGSSGKDRNRILIRSLAGYRVESEPATGQKHVRADPWASQLRAGNVYLVADRPERRWNAAVIDEHVAFRIDQTHLHDDIVDACAGAFNVLAKTPHIDLMEWLRAGAF